MNRRSMKCITIDPMLRRWAEDNIDNFSGWVECQIAGLRSIHMNPDENQKKIDDIQKEIDEAIKKIKELESKVTLNLSLILELKTTKQKKSKEVIQKAKYEQEAIRRSGIMGRIGL